MSQICNFITGHTNYSDNRDQPIIPCTNVVVKGRDRCQAHLQIVPWTWQEAEQGLVDELKRNVPCPKCRRIFYKGACNLCPECHDWTVTKTERRIIKQNFPREWGSAPKTWHLISGSGKDSEWTVTSEYTHYQPCQVSCGIQKIQCHPNGPRYKSGIKLGRMRNCRGHSSNLTFPA